MSRTRKSPYTGSKRVDTSCRCHGSCGWCNNNRLHFDRRRRAAAAAEIREYKQAN